MSQTNNLPTVGLFGFGAFGRLIAEHLHVHLPIIVYDPVMQACGPGWYGKITIGSVGDAGRCDIVILAIPVSELRNAIRSLRPHLRPGAIVIDVGSVKLKPARIMLSELPEFVDVIGMHPLFGPQSASEGIAGHKIAVCPIRGQSRLRVAAFLCRVLRLKVYVTSAEAHDREAAVVQGLTHLIAKVLLRMGPLPTKLTTASFDHLVQAAEMVRYDAPGVFNAIEQDNPFATDVRERFFALAEEARAELEHSDQLTRPEPILATAPS